MTEPVIAQKSPYAVKVNEGKRYFWCACGRSKNQPFCDGSHKGTGITPIRFVGERDGTIYFCGCKRSGKRPICDGTHKSL